MRDKRKYMKCPQSEGMEPDPANQAELTSEAHRQRCPGALGGRIAEEGKRLTQRQLRFWPLPSLCGLIVVISDRPNQK